MAVPEAAGSIQLLATAGMVVSLALCPLPFRRMFYLIGSYS